MKEDIENKKWIEISLGMRASSSILIKSKIKMREYAEELNWIVNVDKKGSVTENGARVYDVSIIPKGGLISPEEFRKKKDLIIGFAYDLFKDLMPNADDSDFTFLGYPLNFLEAKKPEDIEMYFLLGQVLSFNYKLVDRLKLEKNDVNLAKIVFNEIVEENFKKMSIRTGFFNKIIEDKEIIKLKEKYKERTWDWFKIKIK